MMTLHEKQVLFARLLARLIQQSFALGYEITVGEVWRSDATAELYAQQGKGISHSLHRKRLAVDLNLFKNGIYLSASEDYRLLGEWWEAQDSECRWGGRFKDAQGKPKPDGTHFSVTHEGIA
jgi:hypothetical protein